jgi:hypothetical protein
MVVLRLYCTIPAVDTDRRIHNNAVTTAIAALLSTLPHKIRSSSMSFSSAFGPWPPRCLGLDTFQFLRGEDVIPTPDPQPGGRGYLSLPGTSLRSCPAWTLSAAKLSPS